MEIDTRKAAIQLMVDDLIAWGWWAQTCGSKKIGYPSETPFNKLRPYTFTTETGRAYSITQERAEQIDREIAAFDEQTRILMRYKYVCGASMRMCSDWWNANHPKDKISKDKVRSILENCVVWLAATIAYEKTG